MSRTAYDFLFLSPHLDDVVLSCGGFLWHTTAAGRTALVATFFAGDPPRCQLPPLAKKAHELWGLTEDVMHIRRDEDARACCELGVDYIHMGMLDCIYRRDPQSSDPLYPSQQDVFGTIHPVDLRTAPGELAELIHALPSAYHVLAPLGLGNHVDHQLLRSAVQRSSVDPVSFYEDYPYCVDAQISGPRGTQVHVHTVSDLALEAKIRAIRAYESQIGPIFSTEENIRHHVTAHLQSMGGERFWQTVEI